MSRSKPVVAGQRAVQMAVYETERTTSGCGYILKLGFAVGLFVCERKRVSRLPNQLV